MLMNGAFLLRILKFDLQAVGCLEHIYIFLRDYLLLKLFKDCLILKRIVVVIILLIDFISS